MRSAVAAFVSLALLGGGLLHAVIPHSHGDGDNHGQSHESAEWESLHSALNHEDKKVLASSSSVDANAVLAFLANLSIAQNISREYLRNISFQKNGDPYAGDLLRRGIEAYVAFG